MIRKLDRSHADIIGYEATGNISEDEYQHLYAELRALIDRHGSVRVLGRFRDIPGMELSAIDDRLAFAREHLDDIEKAAVVTDTTAGTWMSSALDKLTGVEVRQFDLNDEITAWEWLET